jgi:hypothetical protein
MTVMSSYCRVLGRPIARLTNRHGQLEAVLCREWDQTTGACRLKVEAEQSGLLPVLLEAVGEPSGTRWCGVSP